MDDRSVLRWLALDRGEDHREARRTPARCSATRSLGLARLGAVALAASLAAIVVAAASQAQAITWLEQAFPEGELAGPARAKGALIWSHGRSPDSEDSLSPTPSYMATLQQAGWDAYRLNRLRADDTLEGSARALTRVVGVLKTQGYDKVALAGQSFGAFLSLMAADASDDVFAVIATAPAAYGSFSDFFESWRDNATLLYPLLEKVRHARVLLFYFHGDEFDPGGRGDRSREILASRGVQHYVVDQPRALVGHLAASSGLFTRRYAQCLSDFLDAEQVRPEMRCEARWGANPSAQLALPSGLRSGKSVGARRPGSPFIGRWYGVYPNGREVLLAIEQVEGADAQALYGLGPAVGKDDRAEWTRRIGHASGGELVFKGDAGSALKYRLRPDGQLAATWVSPDGRATLETILRRID